MKSHLLEYLDQHRRLEESVAPKKNEKSDVKSRLQVITPCPPYISFFCRSLCCRRSSGKAFPTRARRRWGRFRRLRPLTLRYSFLKFCMYAFHLSSVPPARSHYCSTPPPTSKLCLESLQCRRMRPRQGSSATQTTRLGAAEVLPHLGVIILICVAKLSTPTSGDVGPGSLGSSSSSLLEDSPRLLPTTYTPSPPRLPRLRPVSRSAEKERSKTKTLSHNAHSSPLSIL